MNGDWRTRYGFGAARLPLPAEALCPEPPCSLREAAPDPRESAQWIAGSLAVLSALALLVVVSHRDAPPLEVVLFDPTGPVMVPAEPEPVVQEPPPVVEPEPVAKEAPRVVEPAPAAQRVVRPEPVPAPAPKAEPTPRPQAPRPAPAPRRVAPPRPVALAAAPTPEPPAPTRRAPRARPAPPRPVAAPVPALAAPTTPQPFEVASSRPTRTARSRPAPPRPPAGVTAPALAAPAPPARDDTAAVARATRATPQPAPRARTRPNVRALPAAVPAAPEPAPVARPRAARPAAPTPPQRQRGSSPDQPKLRGVALGSLASCVSDRDEDQLKQRVIARVSKPGQCASRQGTWGFVETKNLNAFLMWVDRGPNRRAGDRCTELSLALDCVSRHGLQESRE